MHTPVNIPFTVPQCRPLVSPCVYCTAFCSMRVNVCVTRDDPWSRVCVRARATLARKALPNVRNWWNAVPGRPTNTVGTVAWNEGHLGALTVKPPLGRWRTHTKRRWFEPPFFPSRLWGTRNSYRFWLMCFRTMNIKTFDEWIILTKFYRRVKNKGSLYNRYSYNWCVDTVWEICYKTDM